MNELGTMGFGDLLGSIGGTAVHDEDPVGPTGKRLETEPDVGFFILRDDQDVDQTVTSQERLEHREREWVASTVSATKGRDMKNKKRNPLGKLVR